MSLQQLSDEIKKNLEAKGSMSILKSHLRSEIFDVLQQRTVVHPQQVNEIQVLINMLIRDYLHWTGYKNTESVFIKESNQANHTEEALPEGKFLALQVGCEHIHAQNPDIPLLYSIVKMLQLNRPERQGKILKEQKKHMESMLTESEVSSMEESSRMSDSETETTNGSRIAESIDLSVQESQEIQPFVFKK